MKVYTDIETTGTDIFHSQILEVCFMFVEGDKVIEVVTEKITLIKDRSPKTDIQREACLNWLNGTPEFREGLKFNGIKKIEQLVEHERKAVKLKDLWEVLKITIEKLTQGRKEKLNLTGWNLASFDVPILRREIGAEFEEIFDYHYRDIMHNFRVLKERGQIKGLKLSLVHEDLIGSIGQDEFHNAETDCKATMELDKWFEKHVSLKVSKK